MYSEWAFLKQKLNEIRKVRASVKNDTHFSQGNFVFIIHQLHDWNV